MSTRSMICRKDENGTYECIYCHNDGYLEHNGQILLEYYTDPEDVKNLISMGSLSSLQEKIVPDYHKEHSFNEPQEEICIFYHRDRKEPWYYNAPIEFFSLVAMKMKMLDIDYIYIFQDGNWYYKSNKDKDFWLLTKDVVA